MIYKHEYSKSVYDMKLHEELEDKSNSSDILHMRILRVPGGWIYYSPYTGSRSGTFVPFDNEFQSKNWSVDIKDSGDPDFNINALELDKEN